jgi:hypothetical protein
LIPNSCLPLVQELAWGYPEQSLARVPTSLWGTEFYSRVDNGGRQILVDALTQFAEQSRNSRLLPIIRHIAAPLRVAVRVRDGARRGSVAALTAAGVRIDICRGSLRLLGRGQ